MKHVATTSLLVLFAVLPSFSMAAGPLPTDVTTETLLEEMVDMNRLSRFPNPAYKTIQFSSYDRRSNSPGGPEWFANSDGFGNEPIPNFEGIVRKPDQNGIGEYLICDVQSPGALVRVWTASNRGTIRMYLDDSKTPVYDGPATEFLHEPFRRFATASGVDPALFEATYKQRDACYFPIPFAKRCRIVWIGNVRDIHFYEVQVRKYVPGTRVVSFSPDRFKQYIPTIKRVAEVLADPKGKWTYTSTTPEIRIRAGVAPKETAEILAIDGPSAIERLTLRVTADDLDRALRQTILHITFDDHPWAQVQSPIGDFFGAAPGINPFDSVPFTVEPDGTMTCRFVMPFAKSCRIRVENRGNQPVKIDGSALDKDTRWDADRSMHFRARWRVDHDLVAGSGIDAQDLPFILANGQGVYVGTAVMLLNPSPLPWPYGSWWGEGDEKIFVDDDVRPSTFGTGSEDYFNYSWSVPDIFGFPYCGQPRDDGPANRGFVVNQRWHVLDALPFNQRLGFYMELYSHERTPDFSYARIGYHYGRPGLTDDHVNITDEDVRHLELPENWVPAARMGSRGAKFFEAEDVITDKRNTTSCESNLWTRGSMLVWRPAKKGEEISFELPVEETGRYLIRLTTARTPESGKISVRLDDKAIGIGGPEGIVDLKTEFRTLSRNLSSGPLELTKGKHPLTIQNESDTPGIIGIDFIWVQKQ